MSDLSSEPAPSRRSFLAPGALWRRVYGSPSALFGLAVVALFLAAGLGAPWLAPQGPDNADLAQALQPPSASHLLGTDELGRDLAVRLLYGARVSLLVGATAVAVGVVSGVPVGLLTGYRRGVIDLTVTGALDMLQAFPPILLALGMVAIAGQSPGKMAVAIGVAGVPAYARLARGVALSVSQEDFVLGARALGAGDTRILVRHILPAALPPLLVLSSLQVAGAVLTSSGLSFLGLGMSAQIPEWGGMLAKGRSFIFSAPHLILFPGIALMLLVLGFNLLGDGLRDVLDPRLRR